MRVRARVLFSQTGSVSGERASPAMTVNAGFERPLTPGESQNPFLEESEPRATAYDRGVPSCTWTEAHRDGRKAPLQGSRRRHLSRLNVHSLRTQPGKNLSVGRKIGTSAICLGSRMLAVSDVARHNRKEEEGGLRGAASPFSAQDLNASPPPRNPPAGPGSGDGRGLSKNALQGPSGSRGFLKNTGLKVLLPLQPHPPKVDVFSTQLVLEDGC